MHRDASAPVSCTGDDAELHRRLERFVDLLCRWNPAINLVSRGSLDKVWTRHIADSLQLWDLVLAEPKLWVDLGSGGGFPGAVVAIAANTAGSTCRFRLVESDQRKASFLMAVSRETGAGFDVVCARIEGLPPQNADVVSARALSPLEVLCGYAHRHLDPAGIAIFPKGRAAEREISEARKNWKFNLESRPSKSDPEGKLLLLRGLQHV